MSGRIPGYPDPSFNSEESEAYAPSEDAAEVPEALAASSRRFSGPQGSGSATSETPSSGAGRRPNIRQSGPRGGSARAGVGAARSAPRTVAPGYRPRLVRRLFAAGGCVLFSILVAWVAVFTVTGQAIDTLSMEAAMRWAEPLGAVGSTVTHIISVPAMVAVGGLIVLIAWLRRRPTLAGRALGMIVAANTTTQVAKLLIDRPDFHVSAAILNSLPSGHTTVAMDYGVIRLDGDTKVHLYGTPGQERFNFMWEILSKGSMGLILLLDNTRANPLKDLTFFLDAFKDLLKTAPLVVGVTKMDVRSLPGIDVYQKYLAQHNFNVPVFEVDARQEEDVKQLVSAMLFSIDPGLEA